MKTLLTTTLVALTLSSNVFALETSVVPKVTELQTKNPTSLLLVGNSYTYYNCGLNGYISGLARAANKPNWKARMITISAGRLSYHPIDEYLRNDLEQETLKPKPNGNLFDVVFLQAQSIEPINTKNGANVSFRKYLKKHIESVRKAGSEPVVVATWGRQGNSKMSRELADATIAEANANNAIVLPIGLAFEESLKSRPDLILHHTDKTHPSAAGSYLFGALAYSLLFKESPEGLKFAGGCAKPLAEKDIQHLQSTAWKVAKEFYGWK